MAMLTREDLLAASLKKRLKHEVVQAPEWGGEVTIWEVGALERAAFLEGAGALGESPSYRAMREHMARAVAMCLGDESGVFEPRMPPEDLLAGADAALGRAFDVAFRINVMSQQAAEELRKNSLGDPSADSRSSSPVATDSST